MDTFQNLIAALNQLQKHFLFDANDQLVDAKLQEKVLELGKQLATTTRQLLG